MMRTQISDVLMPDGAREQIAAIMRSRLRKAGLRGPYAEADCDLGKRMAKLTGKGEGAYLWGEPGTGKTYAAACAVRLAVLDGTSAKLVTTSRLLDDIRSEYDGGERGALRRAERYRLLALDDLGAERPTEWAIETLTRLIDTRVAEGLPTIVTSNYRIGQIRDLWGGHGRKARRIAPRRCVQAHRGQRAGQEARMIVSASQLRGVPKDRAELYGKPHVGARYVGNRYELTAERCGICGRQATNCHHIVPRRCGDFALVTPRGTWRLRSPLIALCGSGTTGCHDGFHGGARYRPEWVWDEPEFEEAWWDGTLLCEHEPHDPALYAYGHWAITDTKTGRTIEITEG